MPGFYYRIDFLFEKENSGFMGRLKKWQIRIDLKALSRKTFYEYDKNLDI